MAVEMIAYKRQLSRNFGEKGLCPGVSGLEIPDKLGEPIQLVGENHQKCGRAVDVSNGQG